MKMMKLIVSALLVLLWVSCEKNESSLTPEADDVTQSGQVIPGQYIVVLKSGAVNLKAASLTYEGRKAAVKESAKAFLPERDLNERPFLQVYGTAVKGFAAELSDNELTQLQNNSNVEKIYPDRMFILRGKPPVVDPTPPAQTVPYGIARVGTGDGTGKTAWVIDTGIDYDHPDLLVDATRAQTFVTRTTTADDDNGHGTHCAGIIAALNNEIGVVGVAAGATVVPVKVLDKRGSGAYSQIIAGVDYVTSNASPGDAANLSLGGSIYEPIDLAVEALGASGVYVALAAGNESDDAEYHSPARAEGVNLFTISACDSQDAWAYFSNYGTHVDFCEPGVNVLSTYKGGGYTTMSGTSMAAPHMAGILLMTGGKPVADGFVSGDPDGNPDPIGIQ